LGLGRKLSAFTLGALAWVVGAATVVISGSGGWIDFLSGSVLLPLGGLLVAVFVGWVAPRQIMRDELRNTSDGLFRVWRFFIRYLAPVAVSLILLFSVDSKFEFGLNGFIGGLAT
jgi:NSS family neurotransmitter:Na+ symporter